MLDPEIPCTTSNKIELLVHFIIGVNGGWATIYMDYGVWATNYSIIYMASQSLIGV